MFKGKYGGATPPVTRLQYYEEGDQEVRYEEDDQDIRGTLATVKETQFIKWMEQNKLEMEADKRLKDLLENPDDNVLEIGEIQKMKPDDQPWSFEMTYAEFPKYYTWTDKKTWKRRSFKVSYGFVEMRI